MARESYGVGGVLEPGETKRQRLEQRFKALKDERQSFESVWREVADYILPTRARWQTSDTNKGWRKNQKIIDPTAVHCSGILRSGLHSGVTSPSRVWARFEPPDASLRDDAETKRWLHEVRDRMFGIFLRSNLYQTLPILYEDGGSFATGVMAIMEDDNDVIRCYDFPVGSYCIATDEDRRVCEFFHEYRMTVRQLVARFGSPWRNGRPNWTNISDRVREAWERGRMEEWIDVVQVITPNDAHDPNRLESRYKAFSSCYYESASRDGATRDSEKFLEEMGFDEFPIVAFRWAVTGNDAYGTNCPGFAALPDIKELQLVRRKGARALDKVVDPPLQAPIAMRTSVIDTTPSKVTYVVGGPAGKVEPLYTVAPDLNALREWREELRAQIRLAFHEPTFLMLQGIDRANITATEIMERREEKMQMLGPVLERLNDDVLEPLIDRTFAIMWRRGLIPPPPEAMEGKQLRVEYESIMSQAQKSSGVGVLVQLKDQITDAVQKTGNPAILDKWDADQWVDELGTSLGTPPRAIRSDEDVAALRQSRAEEQQAAAAAERLPAVAGAAKSLSETKLGQGSALDEMLSGAAGSAQGMAPMGAAA